LFFGSQQFNERNKSTISEKSIQIVRDQMSPVNENEDFLEHDQETNVEEQRNVCSINISEYWVTYTVYCRVLLLFIQIIQRIIIMKLK